MTRVLSLDLATTTGFAVHGGGVITSGSQCFARHAGNKTRAADHTGEPFAQFHRWLAAKLRDDKPEIVVYEEATGHFKSAHASRAIFGLRGVMLAMLAAHGLPAIGYGAHAIKKFWTGSGNADKDAMMAATRSRCPGIDFTDNNESDALALLHLHLSKLTST